MKEHLHSIKAGNRFRALALLENNSRLYAAKPTRPFLFTNTPHVGVAWGAFFSAILKAQITRE